MTDKEYDQKKRECWDEYTRKSAHEGENAYGAFNFAFDRAYALGKQTETITQEEIEKAAERFADKEYMTNQYERDALYKGYYHGMKDALGKQEKDADTVIKGWVARDEDRNLFMYSTKPERFGTVWMGEAANFDVRNYLFPYLTWESEPEQVEIIIKRKKI